jgi:hypothetical protein
MRADQQGNARGVPPEPGAARRGGRVDLVPARQARAQGRCPGRRDRRGRRPRPRPWRRPQRRRALRDVPGPSADPRRRRASPAARAEHPRRPPSVAAGRARARPLPAPGHAGETPPGPAAMSRLAPAPAAGLDHGQAWPQALAEGVVDAQKILRRQARCACRRGLGPSTKPSTKPSISGAGLAPNPPCKCTPLAPTGCMTTPPQRRSRMVMQPLGMVEHLQGGSGAIDLWSCGMHLSLIEEIERRRSNNRNCKTTWSDGTIIGSLRGNGASAWGGCGRGWRVGSGGRFAPGLGAVLGAARGLLG